MMGSTGFHSPGEIWASLFTSTETDLDSIIRGIRLPRASGAVLVGLTLGMAGSALQSLFRNPLADPYIAGVSSGAAVGGALAFVSQVGFFASGFGMMVAACIGGGLSLCLVIALATHRRTLSAERLLLAGVMVGSLLASILSLVLLATGNDSNKVLHWLLGSVASVDMADLWVLGAGALLGAPILISLSKQLNVLAMGSDAARRAGVNSGRLTLIILATTTVMVSATVGIVGIITFLGLAAPHIARRLVGVDWRHSLIASAMVGGTLLCFADLLAQMAVKGGEVPVGIVTAIIGAPFLLILLRRD